MKFNTKYLTTISILLLIMLVSAPFFVLSFDEVPIIFEDESPILFEDESPFIFEDESPFIFEDEIPIIFEGEKPLDEQPIKPEESGEEGEYYDTFDEVDDMNEMPGGGDADIPNEPVEEPFDEPMPVIQEVDGIGLHVSAMRYDDKINSGDQLLFMIYLKNNGDIDLDNTEITLVNQELGLRAHAGPFDFNDGRRAKKKMLLTFPNEVESGTYYLRITINSKGIKRIVHRELEIM